MLNHVVMWKFKAGEEEKMNEFLNGLKSLKGQIEDIKDMRVGVSVNESNDYDAVLIVSFENSEGLERYKNDPRHLAVSKLCKAIRTARGCVDFVD